MNWNSPILDVAAFALYAFSMVFHFQNYQRLSDPKPHDGAIPNRRTRPHYEWRKKRDRKMRLYATGYLGFSFVFLLLSLMKLPFLVNHILT